MRTVVLLAIVVLGACSELPSTPAYVSGSRLRAVRWVPEDGTAQFDRWHDTELDVDCDFATATDGSWILILRNSLIGSTITV